MNVKIDLRETAAPLEYEAQNTYTKGPMFCVYTTDERVIKIPLVNIWRVVETYTSATR